MEFELVLEEWEGYGQVEDSNKDILGVCVEVKVREKDSGRKNVETGQRRMASRVPDRETVCVLQNAGKERIKHRLVDEAGDRGTDFVSSRESLQAPAQESRPVKAGFQRVQWTATKWTGRQISVRRPMQQPNGCSLQLSGKL